MTYYVISDDGSRFGPADKSALAAWVAQGRVIPSTTLEEAETGRTFRASEMPELWGRAGKPKPLGDYDRIGLLTPSPILDRILGILLALSPVLIVFVGPFFFPRAVASPFVMIVVSVGLYFGMREKYPVFAKGIGNGCVVLVLLALGAFALCLAALSQWK